MQFKSRHEWKEALKHTSKLVLVEGANDRAALERLGVAHILEVSKKPHYLVVEEVQAIAKEVIILTDLDREGKKYYAQLRNSLQRFGIKIDHGFREFLMKEKRLTHIESLK